MGKREIPMRTFLARLRSDKRGQGMTEYIIIVALVAIVAIGIVTVFGDSVRKIFFAASSAMAGDPADPGIKRPDKKHVKTKTMKNFYKK